VKLLVSGGAGFIGTNFVRYWVDRYPEDEIAVLDKLTYAGHLENLKGLKVDFIKGDICDRKVVARAMAGVDVVVHFAAETHVDRSIIDPDIFIKSNIIGTETLCRAAIKAKIKRFHHISTDEVFGALALTTNGKFTEKTAYSPRSPYAVSKATSDFIVRMYHHTYGLPITITNTSNNYGPYQDPEKFIPRMITNAIDNQPLPIYGDGLYVRDWIHTYDHCTAIDLILTKGKVGETYLVGANSERNNLAVVKLILKYLGKPESLITSVKDRPGHDRRYALDSRKIKRELGWKPEHKFEYWLKRVVKWYVDNEAWWRPLKKRAESIYK